MHSDICQMCMGCLRTCCLVVGIYETSININWDIYTHPTKLGRLPIPCCAEGPAGFRDMGRSPWNAGTRSRCWQRRRWNLYRCFDIYVIVVWVSTACLCTVRPRSGLALPLQNAAHFGDLVLHKRDRPQRMSGREISEKGLRAETHVTRKRCVPRIQNSCKKK